MKYHDLEIKPTRLNAFTVEFLFPSVPHPIEPAQGCSLDSEIR